MEYFSSEFKREKDFIDKNIQRLTTVEDDIVINLGNGFIRLDRRYISIYL